MAIKKKSFKLTASNYYSSERPHLSNSMVSDYLKSKEYYFKKHVLKSLEREETASMRIGSMVDNMLCGHPLKYQVKVLKRDDPERYAMQQEMPDHVFCSEREFQEAQEHAKNIMRQPCYKWYAENGASFQHVLVGEVDGTPVCGMADVVTETEDAVFIDDFKVVGQLKTTSTAKWFYNCLDFGYFRQLAAYKYMWQQKHPDDKRPVITRHLVTTKIENGLYKVLLFNIPMDLLVTPEQEFLMGVRGIVRSTESNDWEDPLAQWSDSILMKDPRTEEEDEWPEDEADD